MLKQRLGDTGCRCTVLQVRRLACRLGQTCLLGLPQTHYVPVWPVALLASSMIFPAGSAGPSSTVLPRIGQSGAVCPFVSLPQLQSVRLALLRHAGEGALQTVSAWLVVISSSELLLMGTLMLCTQTNSALTTTGERLCACSHTDRAFIWASWIKQNRVAVHAVQTGAHHQSHIRACIS